jgi:hypothetical protein
MSTKIPDFTPRELNLIKQCLKERYGHEPPVEVAEAELMLDQLTQALDPCPTVTWQERDANFVVSKTGDNRFRCQFYYIESQQFGTGKDEYDNLGDCVVTLLQVQADHELSRKGIRSGMNAVDFSKANDGEEYFGPLIV